MIRLLRGWYGITALAVVVVVVVAVASIWFVSDTTEPVATLADAEDMCHAAGQAGLDVTDSDLDSPNMESGTYHRTTEKATCNVDADVGDWSITNNANAYSQVQVWVAKADNDPDQLDEYAERDCSRNDNIIKEHRDHLVCVEEEGTGQSHMEISSTTYISNVTIDVSLSAQTERDTATSTFPVLDSQSVDAARDIHAEMVDAALAVFEQLD